MATHTQEVPYRLDSFFGIETAFEVWHNVLVHTVLCVFVVAWVEAQDSLHEIHVWVEDHQVRFSQTTSY